jgi:anhydro-N-acetylmuramic acid kinase
MFKSDLQNIFAIGLMSGTSLDGLDIALCEFNFEEIHPSFRLIACESIEYPVEIREKLSVAHNESALQLRLIEIEFTNFCAEQVNKFVSNSQIKPHFIASHGHTIFHRPDKKMTLQIGDGETLAKLCGIPVVSDFRTGDVALGGQGAPLVPIGDELLFGNYDACLNLGGFSNVSFRDEKGKRIAYDISPVNIVLNKLAALAGKEYDDKGSMAAVGIVCDEMLKELNSLNYYSNSHPKSLGREWVEANVDAILYKFAELPLNDRIATFTVHSAQQIAKNLDARKNVLVTGGGAYNEFLISKIREYCSTEVIIPDKNLIEFKEALVFAFLGALRIKGQNNCLASVTGAERDSCSGKISVE